MGTAHYLITMFAYRRTLNVLIIKFGSLKNKTLEKREKKTIG